MVPQHPFVHRKSWKAVLRMGATWGHCLHGQLYFIRFHGDSRWPIPSLCHFNSGDPLITGNETAETILLLAFVCLSELCAFLASQVYK